MRNAYLDKAIELRPNNVAFASAQIVRRVAPSSGKPGDQAIRHLQLLKLLELQLDGAHNHRLP